MSLSSNSGNPEPQPAAATTGTQVSARARSARWEDLRRTTHRLRRSHLSLVGLAIIVGLILMAIFAPYLAPYPEDIDSVHFERMLQLFDSFIILMNFC